MIWQTNNVNKYKKVKGTQITIINSTLEVYVKGMEGREEEGGKPFVER